jgi:hypothetical protein
MTFGAASIWKASLVGLVVGLMSGITLEYAILKPKPTKTEPTASAVRQSDGSLELERNPNSTPVVPHVLPKGSTLEREVQVMIKLGRVTPPTTQSDSSPKGIAPEAAPCPDVHMDLSLVRMPDSTERVIVSSPDGDVVGGLDMPVDIARQARDLKWTVGGTWNPAGKTIGFFVDRDLGPFRVGAEVFQVRGMQGITWAGQIKAGVRF